MHLHVPIFNRQAPPDPASNRQEKRRGDWMETFTGIKFYPLDPRPGEICIEDIAHALSMQCRFTGHVKEFYSVAQHSFIVSHLCPRVPLWGLLHDAGEAYLADMITPIKRQPLMAPYCAAEKRLMRVICRKFGLPEKEPPEVKDADLLMVATEARALLSVADWTEGRAGLRGGIVPVGPTEAERMFLERFRELTANEAV